MTITELLEKAEISDYIYIEDVLPPLPRYPLQVMENVGLWTVGQVKAGGYGTLAHLMTPEDLDHVVQAMEYWAGEGWTLRATAPLPPDLTGARILPYEVQKKQYRRSTPRSLCPFCGGNPVMVRGNKVRAHKDLRKIGVNHKTPPCLGSGQLSAGLIEKEK